MQLRIFVEPQQGANYADQLRVAKAVEALGFDAFFRSDHYLAMGPGDGLWTTPPGATFSFSGKHYQLTDSPALPKPVQSPRPPLILGGGGKQRSASLAARFADEYNVGFNRKQTGAIFARVREAAARTGRGLVFSVAEVVCVGKDDAQVKQRAEAIGRPVDELVESGIAGSPAQAVDRIGEYAGHGATRVYLQLLDLSDLDHLELIASEVMPQL